MYHKLIKYMKSDNRGAAMVTVLVAIAFLTILGSILLFTSLTGYRLKAAQAVAENRFYDAETAMNEVRAGLQGLTSTTIADSYSRVMLEFDGVNDIDLEFMDKFKYDFIAPHLNKDGTPVVPAKSPSPLFILSTHPKVDDYFGPRPTEYTGGLQFNLAYLQEFLTSAPPANPGDPGTTLSLTSGNTLGLRDIRGAWTKMSPEGVLPEVYEYIISSITLRGLRVEHTSDEGYYSVVESDITFSMPNLAFQRSMFAFREIADYAFIATDLMTTLGSSIRINGNVYTGATTLNESGAELILESGMFINGGIGYNGATNPSLNPIPTHPDINGNLYVHNGNRFTVAPGASVWARNIFVGSSSADSVDSPGIVNLQGNTYTAANLVLRGNNSQAYLSGRYFGFGNSQTVAAESSSIIANSRNNRLDLSGLNYLFIAGRSFISTSSDTDPDVLTGQSMAVRSDQLAYLIPIDIINSHMRVPERGQITSNPCVLVYGDGEPSSMPVYGASADYTIRFNEVLWYVDSNGDGNKDMPMTLSDYNVSDTVVGGVANGTQPLLRPITGSGNQYLFYLFMKFDTVEDANRYFKDYFESNITAISNYVSLYTSNYVSTSNTVQTVGTTFDGTVITNPVTNATSNNVGVLNANFAGGGIIATNLSNEYENRRIYLSSQAPVLETWHADYAYNPFNFIVKGKPNTPTPDMPPAGYYEYDVEGSVVNTAYVHPDTSQLFISSLGTAPSYAELDNIKIIISFGDVVVDRNFEGLILCRGNISLRANVTAGREKLADALRATHVTGGERLGDYLNISIRDDASDDAGNNNMWNLTQLVYYDNWRKS